ncbi:MAG TPA: hypothetical protein VJO35_15430 [Terriglobales bacterium]|nr:hypothetical protein [Terriglobales bacterium]
MYLLSAVAILGAGDTIYYHEWRARLPSMGKRAQKELELHAFRDFIYTVLFCSVPWFAWRGLWAAFLGFLLLAEIALTLWDFVVEDWIRKPLGGVYPGERIMHAIIGLVYGAMLGYFIPILWAWKDATSEIRFWPAPIPAILRWFLLGMGAGVLVSGIRDLLAAFEVPGSAWPWNAAKE